MKVMLQTYFPGGLLYHSFTIFPIHVVSLRAACYRFLYAMKVSNIRFFSPEKVFLKFVNVRQLAWQSPIFEITFLARKILPLICS